jgi:hypothetical protein
LAAVNEPHPNRPIRLGAIDRHRHLSDPSHEIPCDPSARLGPTKELEIDAGEHDWHREPA